MEYKVGEVWVYLTYKATYLKISHPDLSSTEFWFPYDMEPKKGYELTLVNNAALATDEETLERIRKLEEALRNQTEPQIVYVEKPAEQKQKPETTDKPRTPRYSFIVANASINTYSKPAFGVTLGDMRKVGVFATAMTNFRIEKMGFEGKFEHANSDQIQALIDKTGYNSKTDYMSYSVIFGVIFRAYGPINVKIGGGYSSNSMFVTLSYNNNYSSTYWVSDVSSYGFGGLIGVQAHLGNLIISLDGATTNFKIFETRLGIGFGMKGKK